MVADALSRRPEGCLMMDICTDWKAHLLVEYSKNKFACEVMDGQVINDRYSILDDIIFYKDQIYLVRESMLKGKILTVCHNSPVAGHHGYFKTYRKIRERFSWKGLVIAQFVVRIKIDVKRQTGVTGTNPTQCHLDRMVLSS